VQPDAADYFLHVDAVAAVHPRGDEFSARPGVASVIAHLAAAPVRVGVGERRGELGVGEGLTPIG